MDIGAYILSIDDGKEGFELMDQDGWSSLVQRGTTVVMSVVMGQPIEWAQYKCPFCDIWNKLKEHGRQSSINW